VPAVALPGVGRVSSPQVPQVEALEGSRR